MIYAIKPLEWRPDAPRVGPWRAVTPFGQVSIHLIGTKTTGRAPCYVISSKQKRLNRSGRRADTLATLAAAQKAVQATYEAELALWLEEAAS